jgi:MFS family permease
MGVSGVLTLILGVLSWLALRDDPSEYGYKSHAPAVVQDSGSLAAGKALKSVISQKDTWLLFFAGGLSAAPVLVFAGLWGVPYLTQIYGLGTSKAALITSTMLFSFALSGPAVGMLSDRLGRRRLLYLILCICTAIFWAVFLFIPLPYQMLFPLLAAIGFTSGALIIGFAAAREVNHPGAAGVVGGVVNMSVLGVAAIMQPVLGKILDLHWLGIMAEGARVYNQDAYSAAFIWLLVSSGMAVVMVFFTTETYCRMQEIDS